MTGAMQIKQFVYPQNAYCIILRGSWFSTNTQPAERGECNSRSPASSNAGLVEEQAKSSRGAPLAGAGPPLVRSDSLHAKQIPKTGRVLCVRSTQRVDCGLEINTGSGRAK